MTPAAPGRSGHEDPFPDAGSEAGSAIAEPHRYHVDMSERRVVPSPDELMRLYEAATAAHDLEATLALIADDAVYLFSNQSSHHGKDAVRAVLEKNFDLIKAETYEIRDLTWLAKSDEVAACVYEYHWSGEINGKPASGRGRGTSVLKRVEGAWRVAHEHLSAGLLRPAKLPGEL